MWVVNENFSFTLDIRRKEREQITDGSNKKANSKKIDLNTIIEVTIGNKCIKNCPTKEKSYSYIIHLQLESVFESNFRHKWEWAISCFNGFELSALLRH